MSNGKTVKATEADRRAAPAISAAGELVHQLRKASAKREGDLVKFDKKLASLRSGAQDASSKKTLARLEKRRTTLEEEAELLRTSLGAAEALGGALLELREELVRAGGGADAQYEQLRGQVRMLAAEKLRLNEEIESKDDVIFELQEVVHLLSLGEDSDPEDELEIEIAVEEVEEIEEVEDLAIVEEAPASAGPPDLENVAARKERLKRESQAKKAREKKAKLEAKERAKQAKLIAKERLKQAKQAARDKARLEKEARAKAEADKAAAAKAAKESAARGAAAKSAAQDGETKPKPTQAAKPMPPVAPPADDTIDLDPMDDDDVLDGESLEVIGESEDVSAPPLVDVPPPSRGARHPGLSSYSHVPSKQGTERPAGAEAARLGATTGEDSD